MGQTEVVTLPRLETYTAEQLRLARDASPAFARYERLLADPEVDRLHARRHLAWMECVLAEYIHGETLTAAACAHWSATAEALLSEVWAECGLGAVDAVLIALGKQGAHELNLSSDIDLMVVADPREAAVTERALRRFQQRLQTPGEWGFCFRLDFDLRPGGKMGPLITSPSQFQDYYWSQGETWERLALVRLNVVCGSEALAAPVRDLAERFSFRRFLDYTLLEDLKALRAQVHQKGFERREGELHLKLEVGGIRDIELFVHSLLVLNGGKLPAVRTRSTGSALERLEQHRLLPAAEAAFLRETYWHFRHIENLVQSMEDRQTHVVPDRPLPLPGLPARAELERRMGEVNRIVSGLLGQVDLDLVHLPAGEAAQAAWLRELGFSEVAVVDTWAQLIKATALSHKNDRDERARREFLHSFVTELAGHKRFDRDLGLSLLLDFVRATRGKATFFSMLLRTPRLIADLARLFSQSPYLGAILAARPELLDHFILQADEDWSQDVPTLLRQMSERKLLAEIWAANRYLNDGDLPALFARLSEAADEIAAQLLRQLKREHPQATLEIIALGKWGGRELGLRSDLDFIFITPDAPTEADFKVARRFISRLTDPMKSGRLYDVDLRLRPSGQAGPLLVKKEMLLAHWRDSARPWERQAHLRARPLDTRIELDKGLLVRTPLSPADLAELKRIREKLHRPGGEHELDLKYSPGGLVDIEFAAQTAVLACGRPVAAVSTSGMMAELAATGDAWRVHGPGLSSIYLELRRFEQMLQLASAHKIGSIARSHPSFVRAAALMGESATVSWSRLAELFSRSRALLNRLDPTGLTF